MRMGRVTHTWVSAKSLPLACPQVRRLTQRDRQEQSHRRRRAQTGHYHLARACHRQTLCRPRCRLLRPPNRPRGRNPPTHRQTPGPGTHRHHRTRSLKPPNDQIRLRRMASPCPVTLDSRTSRNRVLFHHAYLGANIRSTQFSAGASLSAPAARMPVPPAGSTNLPSWSYVANDCPQASGASAGGGGPPPARGGGGGGGGPGGGPATRGAPRGRGGGERPRRGGGRGR